MAHTKECIGCSYENKCDYITCKVEEKQTKSKKRLYVVRDIPDYEDDCSNYCYIVRADNAAKATEIVKKKLGKESSKWKWEASLSDNNEIWE